jgi:arsenite-transporting ATPase
VIANRVFPADDAVLDGWRTGWVAAQRIQLDGMATSFPGLPVWQAGYAAAEPVGISALSELASSLYGDSDPLAVVTTPDPLMVERVAADEFVMSVALPHAERRDVELVRKGDDLVLTVGAHRRTLALPSALQRCAIDGAALRDGRLRVRFRADPDRWMRA